MKPCLTVWATMRQLAHLELVHALVVLDGHLAGLPIDRADEVLALAEALAHGGSHRLLERTEDHLVGDVLLRVQEIDHLQECFGIHVGLLGGNRKGAGDAPLLPAAWRAGPGGPAVRRAVFRRVCRVSWDCVV